MVINKRAKGNRSRKKIINLLEEAGYKVDIVEKTNKYATPKDLFGLWDLIAIKPNLIIFIQITTNRAHLHKDYDKFCKSYHIFGFQIVVRKDNYVLYDYWNSNKIVEANKYKVINYLKNFGG